MLKNLNFNKIKIDKGLEYKLGIIFTVVPAVLYALLLCNKTMPLAEGWYTYYAQLINEGSVVYRDFEYLFMPGYITFIALFTKIFGYSIIALRILGVIFFGIIAYFAYRIFNELFNPVAGCLGAVAAVFYLQSEVVQIFYDYIRFMDIFAFITIFLLIKMSKNFISGENKNFKVTFFAGMANAMVLMVKQNVGLLLGFFVLCFFIFLFLYVSEKKNVVTNLFVYGGGALLVFAAYSLYLIINGAFVDCIEQTLLGATEAKGGIKTILFRWIIEGEDNFLGEMSVVFVAVGVILAMVMLNKLFPADKTTNKNPKAALLIFGIFSIVIILLLYFSESLSEGITDIYQSKMYGFYLFDVIVFFAMIIMYLADIFRKKEKKRYNNYIPIFLILGAIFAIGYAVGMSGGLSQSQIALAVGFIVAFVVALCNSKFYWLTMSLVSVFALCFVIFCGAFKFVSTYTWWGLTCSTIWDQTETVDNVPELKGIKVSEEEKELYEGVYDLVQEYSDEDDSIFCFPFSPELYTFTDRSDPGTFSVVQWFDVSTNETVLDDIEIVEDAEPEVIIIYNIPEYAIKNHEEMFNDDEQSATTTMYDSLRDFCLENGYTAEGLFELNSMCSVTVWVKNSDESWNSGGTGTKSDPYLISSEEQFLKFADMVNSGATFDGQYIKLTADIDLSDCDDFDPIGNEAVGASFDGIFNGNGYSVKNLTIVRGSKSKEKNTKNINDVALFGELKGSVYNLGLENCSFTGYCVAGIVRYSADGGYISNCYVKNCEFTGSYRAGTVADDYSGKIYNCVSIDNTLSAPKGVGMVAYKAQEYTLTNCYSNVSYYLDDAEYITDSELNSEEFVDKLNAFAQAYEDYKSTRRKTVINLADWKIEKNGLGLKNGSK